MKVLVNLDVDDLAKAIRFYSSALGLTVGRRFGDGAVEMLGADVPIYLLVNAPHTKATAAGDRRTYARHWTPVHLDFVVTDIAAAIQRAQKAGAKLERDVSTHAYGRLALLADPFGNGFCLIEFRGRGYDEIVV